MKTKSPQYWKAKKSLRNFLNHRKKDIQLKDFDPNFIARYDFRIGHIEEESVERAVIHFRSNGCLWDKDSGGCTMCGFWGETAQMKKTITTENFINQFKNADKDLQLKNFQIISLYNAGSLLQEKEIPFDAIKEIFTIISKELPLTKRVIIESRIEYITEEKVKALQSILRSDQELGIGIGFESSNDTVRNLCINKGVHKTQFEKCLKQLKEWNVYSIVYLMIKPPFLTEKEAIIDAVESTKYLSQLNPSKIDYETMTVEEGTLISLLYNKGLYTPPQLWTIIEILKQVSSFASPFISPFKYICDSTDIPHNCPKCNAAVAEAITTQYTKSFDVSVFNRLECECKIEWENLCKIENTKSLEDRIIDALKD